jgi:serine protease Do
MRFSAVMAAVIISIGTFQASGATGADERRDARRTPIVRVVEEVGPSIVNISTEKVVRVTDRFFEPFGPDVFGDLFGGAPMGRSYKVASVGSGVVIHPSGYIVTNHHVIAQVSKVVVTTSDGASYEGRFVASLPKLDLALVKVEPEEPLAAVRLGSSADIMIGETVVAVGNPFGYQNTVTQGIVSATDREITHRARRVYGGLIQTDAAINPGSSGGALVNIHGELVGINTAIRAGAEGIGFAIPADGLREALPELLNPRRKRIEMGMTLDERSDDGRRAVVVAAVSKEGPAAEAGVEAGDAIESVDGERVIGLVDVMVRLREHAAGDEVALAIDRAGERVTAKVRLAEIPKPDGAKLSRAKLGLELQELTDELAKALGVPAGSGLAVAGVDEASPAARAGIKAGYVLMRLGARRVHTLDDVGAALEGVGAGDRVVVYVYRRGFFFGTTVEAR